MECAAYRDGDRLLVAYYYSKDGGPPLLTRSERLGLRQTWSARSSGGSRLRRRSGCWRRFVSSSRCGADGSRRPHRSEGRLCEGPSGLEGIGLPDGCGAGNQMGYVNLFLRLGGWQRVGRFSAASGTRLLEMRGMRSGQAARGVFLGTSPRPDVLASAERSQGPGRARIC